MTDTPPARWADRDAACEYLGVTGMTLWRYVRDGILTRHTIGGIARYDLNEVDAVLRGDTTTRAQAVAEALDKVRAALPIGTGRPLINIVQVHQVLDQVAAELGAERPTYTPTAASVAGATRDQ